MGLVELKEGTQRTQRQSRMSKKWILTRALAVTFVFVVKCGEVWCPSCRQ